MYYSHVKPPKTVFVCQECGGQQPKWVGRCPDCGAWNSLVEEQPAPQTAPAAASHRYGLVSGRIGQALQRHTDLRRAADTLWHRRVRSSPGWRHRPRCARVAWRRAGHRKIHAAPAGGRARGAQRWSCSLQLGRGVRAPNQAARRAAVGRPIAAVPARRNLPGENPRRDRAAQARARHRRFDSNRSSRRVFNPRPGASARCARSRRICCSPPRGATFRLCSSATSRRTAISPVPRRWSTSSTPSCTSKGSGITRIASCAPSRTGSARRASSASSR